MIDAVVFLTSHAQDSSFMIYARFLILWGAPSSGNLQLGIASLGFGLQVEGGSGREGSG